MSAAYIQMHSRLDFITEANHMNPDQTAPHRSSLIWVHIVYNIGNLKTYAEERGRRQKTWFAGKGLIQISENGVLFSANIVCCTFLIITAVFDFKVAGK